MHWNIANKIAVALLAITVPVAVAWLCVAGGLTSIAVGVVACNPDAGPDDASSDGPDDASEDADDCGLQMYEDAQVLIASPCKPTCDRPLNNTQQIAAAPIEVGGVTVSCQGGQVAASALCGSAGSMGGYATVNITGAYGPDGGSAPAGCPSQSTSGSTFAVAVNAGSQAHPPCSPVSASYTGPSCTASWGGQTASLKSISGSGTADQAYVNGTANGILCWHWGWSGIWYGQIIDQFAFTTVLTGKTSSTTCN